MAALVLVALAAPAQPPAPRLKRLRDGKPDFSGIWQALGNAHWDLEAHAARQGHLTATGALFAEPGGAGVVEGGVIPYLPAALAKKQANFADRLKLDPEVKCYLPGIPRAHYMPYPFQILHSEKALFFAYEYAGAVRNVFLKDPGPAPTDTWMGQSVLRWEGDTLVITVTGHDDRTWFDRAGNHHSDQLTVTERFKFLSENHLEYEATITDPATFSRAWKIRLPLYRRIEPGARLFEFKCVEFAEELMYGDFAKKPKEKK
jgi:hypothetical protein